jgi:hypothetical protein
LTLHGATRAEPRLELVADGLAFPTSVALDPDGVPYVAEAGLPFGGAAPGGRVWRLAPGRERELVADGLRPPVNGLTWHDGGLYASEGGHPAGIARIDPAGGGRTPVLEGLPGPGNYHTNMTAFGPDGKLYFSQGAMTNSAVVGLDSYEIGWLRRLPHSHDLPGLDVTLAGRNFETADPLAAGGAGRGGDGRGGAGRHGDGRGGDGRSAAARARTGAFVPFGTPTEPGRAVPAALPCTAAVMRCEPDGSDLELVAWGLRNAFGLGFLHDGTLIAIDQGYDDRGSRPVGDAPDLVHEVRPGRWYGWPDYVGDEPITSDRFRPERGPQPAFVLADHASLPPPEAPLLSFETHASAVKFDVAAGGGPMLVALFGDERPMTAPPGARAGRSLALVDPGRWEVAGTIGTSLNRPIDVRYDPADDSFLVLDFGEFEMEAGRGAVARAGSGALWRVPASEVAAAA